MKMGKTPVPNKYYMKMGNTTKPK